MNNKFLKIAIITNVIPSYRKGFYDLLFSCKDISVTVYCQDSIPGLNLKTIHHNYPNNVKIVKYISANRERLVWQFIPWLKIYSHYDVIFLMGNPRVLSDVFFGSLLKIFCNKTVLWTMAHTFSANPITENIRLFWSRLFDFLFVYTDAEVSYLRRKGFSKQYILGMNNGLDQKNIDSIMLTWTKDKLDEWQINNNLKNQTLLLSCARLEPKNKFQLMIEALPLIIAKIPNVTWCIIGNGTEKKYLVSLVSKAGLNNHVRFVGELYKEDDIAPWFLSSAIFVHPAAIGLAIFHAFGYGLPVITHGNSKFHGPEYTAFEPERTGCNFCENNAHDLAETVIKLLQDKKKCSDMKQYVLKIVREKYNVDVMVERFIKIAKTVSNKRID